MTAEKTGFSCWIPGLMTAAAVLMLVGLWSGISYTLNQVGGNLQEAISKEVFAIFLVVLFVVGMVFTLRKKWWGFWLFGATSLLMFVFNGMFNFGGALSQLGVAGFLGGAATLLVYQQRSLLSR